MHRLVRIFSQLSDKFQAELELLHHMLMQIDQVLKDTVWDISESIDQAQGSVKKGKSIERLVNCRLQLRVAKLRGHSGEKIF
jgi:hypothetical protein